EMERFWVERLLARRRLTLKDLEEFWYYGNYEGLWALEQMLLGQDFIPRLVFLGSGPLPLTAVMAAFVQTIEKILCVDCDDAACELSSKLLQALGLESRVTIHRASAQSFDFSPHDLVICASLMEGKARLYDRLLRRGVAKFMVRDVEGAYRYLYASS